MAEQPVAWITRQTKDGKQRLEFGHVATNIEYCNVHHEWEWQPLYLAPQAPPAAVPAGYALVPVEPTPGMVLALAEKIARGFGGKAAYRAMLAAAERVEVGRE